ncbi:TIGR03915 family putative DNA repair protein [Desulfotomaculum sp. 1211_IL3151]|uniref:TIGR03915 family putative DNA repair protein n=1 Tax=Desulfotomaculum sp. 1211_IL3151 TaxID=3084055 RepID=UPI002FD9E94F
MIYFIYDGSFEGLLTAVYEAYYRSERPDYIVYQDEFQQDLFSQAITIHTDQEKSAKVYRAIEDKISFYTLQQIFYVYLSELQGSGTLIYQYLRLGFQFGPKINSNLTEDTVRKVYERSQRVSKERHRMLGLIRFQKLANDCFYATMEPDHNIVGLVSPHFANRLSDQNWIIHDLKRKIAAVYNKKEWLLTNLDIPQGLTLAANEAYYQELWKKYFSSTAIQNRINPKLQKQFMPIRYWKHLIEKKSSK